MKLVAIFALLFVCAAVNASQHVDKRQTNWINAIVFDMFGNNAKQVWPKIRELHFDDQFLRVGNRLLFAKPEIKGQARPVLDQLSNQLINNLGDPTVNCNNALTQLRVIVPQQ